jgi:hypothetical protein
MNTKYELQFLIMVDAPIDIEELRGFIKNNVNLKYNSSSNQLMGNMLRVLQNEDYDPTLIESEDGYMYFKYRLEFVPGDDCDLENQIELARKVKTTMERESAKVEICADFEEML